MKLKPFFALSVLSSTLLLASCNNFQLIPRVDVNASLVAALGETPDFNNTQIEVFVAEEEGRPRFTVPNVRILANARPGSLGVNFDEYSIEYAYADGEIIPTDSGEPFAGSIRLQVPGGRYCPGITDDEDGTGITYGRCDFYTEGSEFAAGPAVVSGSFIPIDIDIIAKLFLGGRPREGAYAIIMLSGVDSNGTPVRKALEPVTVIFLAGTAEQ